MANYPADSCDSQVSELVCYRLAVQTTRPSAVTASVTTSTLPSRTTPPPFTLSLLHIRMQGLIRSCPTLDDPLPLFLARTYAINNPPMSRNTNSTSKFVEGTVQGAQWYTLLGGMQVGL